MQEMQAELESEKEKGRASLMEREGKEVASVCEIQSTGGDGRVWKTSDNHTDEKGEELHYTNQSPPYPPPGWGCDVEKEEESGVKDSTTKGNSCYLDRRCMEKSV